MKTTTLLFLLSASVAFVHGQFHFKGNLMDGQTDQAIEAATIFIADTEIGTISDSRGNFSLEGIDEAHGELVVSHLLYHKQVMKLDFSIMGEQEFSIKLRPRDLNAEAVMIIGEKDPKRKKQLKIFEQAFLGVSDNASRTQILNPGAIHFEEEEGELRAWAHELIRIKNLGLGYELKFSLEEFKLSGTEITYSGKPLFNELEASNERVAKQWARKRQKAYGGSLTHFFRALKRNELRKEGFEIAEAIMSDKGLVPGRTMLGKDILMEKENGDKLLILPRFLEVRYTKETVETAFLGHDGALAQANLGRPSEREMIRQGSSETRGGVKDQTSYIFARKNVLKLDDQGLPQNPKLLEEYGYWAWERVAEMLPKSYGKSGKKTHIHQAVPKRNGFSLTQLRVPLVEIRQGGPPRDGIPAINTPKFLSVDSAAFLQDTDAVLGVFYEGIAKAYPIRIMNWHEIVNDWFGEMPVVLTFCPLCGSGMAFLSEIEGKRRQFGVSGLLYNSDVLLYDRESESLWSQVQSEAIAGDASGQKLDYISTMYTNWGEWKDRYPRTLVLSSETGFNRDYNQAAYADYDKSPNLMFPVLHTSARLPRKEKVLGLEISGKYKAYPFSRLEKKRSDTIEDDFLGRQLTIHFDKESQSAYITDHEGDIVPSIRLYWFAWYAFHPDTEIFQ